MTRCALTLLALLSKVVHSHFCSTRNVNLDSFVSTRRTYHASFFGRQTIYQHFRVRPKFHMATGDSFSRVELLNVRMELKRLRFTSLLVMLRMQFITWVCQNGFDLFFSRNSFVSSRFRHDEEDGSGGSCLHGAKVVSCAFDAAFLVFPEACCVASMPASGRRVVRISR